MLLWGLISASYIFRTINSAEELEMQGPHGGNNERKGAAPRMSLQEPAPIKSSVSLLLSGQQRLNYHKYLITRTKLVANYVEAKELKNGGNREKYSADCLINEVRFTSRFPFRCA